MISLLIWAIFDKFGIEKLSFFIYWHKQKLQFSQQTQILLLFRSSVFEAITPCSPLKVHWHFRGTCHFPLQGSRVGQARNQHEQAACFMLFSCLDYCCSSEMSVDFHWTAWHYIPEIRTVQEHTCKNLKSYMTFINIHRVIKRWSILTDMISYAHFIYWYSVLGAELCFLPASCCWLLANYMTLYSRR
jgi:hypothetical protein